MVKRAKLRKQTTKIPERMQHPFCTGWGNIISYRVSCASFYCRPIWSLRKEHQNWLGMCSSVMYNKKVWFQSGHRIIPRLKRLQSASSHLQRLLLPEFLFGFTCCSRPCPVMCVLFLALLKQRKHRMISGTLFLKMDDCVLSLVSLAACRLLVVFRSFCFFFLYCYESVIKSHCL